jgi:urease accessory protein UreH
VSKIQNPNWHGKIDLQFIKTDRLKTELWRNYACAPLKLQRPFYPEGDICHAVLLHSAGGMVGGDRLSYKIDLAPESRLLMTTAAATKIYRSNGSIATQQIEINVGDNACLEWLPQETIRWLNLSISGKRSPSSSTVVYRCLGLVTRAISRSSGMYSQGLANLSILPIRFG